MHEVEAGLAPIHEVEAGLLANMSGRESYREDDSHREEPSTVSSSPSRTYIISRALLLLCGVGMICTAGFYAAPGPAQLPQASRRLSEPPPQPTPGAAAITSAAVTTTAASPPPAAAAPAAATPAAAAPAAAASPPRSRSTYHWPLGALAADATGPGPWLRDSFTHLSPPAEHLPLPLSTTGGTASPDAAKLVPNLPLNIVRLQRPPSRAPPRGPDGQPLSRPPLLPAPPSGAVWVERPAFSPPEISAKQHYGINCLSTRQPLLRTRRFREWTVEAVVSFLDSPHFGRAWQAVVGRNGGNFSADAFDSRLGAFYVKLSPNASLLLEAWVQPDDPAAPPRYVSIVSEKALKHSEWYSIAASSDGSTMRLVVNGETLGEASVAGSLAVPPLQQDGDFTFGAASVGGKIDDPCSCLLSEARISEHVVPPAERLWAVGGQAGAAEAGAAARASAD